MPHLQIKFKFKIYTEIKLHKFPSDPIRIQLHFYQLSNKIYFLKCEYIYLISIKSQNTDKKSTYEKNDINFATFSTFLFKEIPKMKLSQYSCEPLLNS